MASKQDPGQLHATTHLSEPAPMQVLQDGCHSSYSGLESLPSEIRRLLLSTMDLPTLNTIVRASPTFYQQYLLDRQFILGRTIEKTLGSVAIDAYGAYIAAVQTGYQGPEWLQLFSDHSVRSRLMLLDCLTEEEILRMAFFYLQVVQPVRELYTSRIRGELSSHGRVNSHGSQSHMEATHTELTRLTRAVYRFEIICQLGNPTKRTLESQRRIMKAYLGFLEPWEIEELLSFYQFAYDKYDKILESLRGDLHPENPNFKNPHRLAPPTGALRLNTGNALECYLEGLTLSGLSVLHKTLIQTKDRQHLISIVQQQMRSSWIPFNASEGIFGEVEQAIRRSNNPSERDGMQERREAFPFRGDGEPGAPPLAWTIIWGGTYSNLYGGYIPDIMRRWGYVFWDAETLGNMGGKEVLRRHWHRIGGSDPRDLSYN